MAWDAKAAPTTRRRASSSANRASTLSATTLPLQQKAGAPASSSAIQPKSAHVADPFLQDFLRPGFDPAAYWNRTLANVSSSSSGGRPGSGAASRLAAAAAISATATATADRAAQAQATLSQLGAHTSRLTTVLTQLTDEILRSGSRLAYEVELLRGETISLAELVQQQAAAISEADVDAEAGAEAGADGADKTGSGGDDDDDNNNNAEERGSDQKNRNSKQTVDPSEPASLAQLRMLAQVRSRLDAVIHTFGDAMEFVMPPSAMSVTASFLSVSGPDQDSRRRSSSSSNDAGDGAGDSANNNTINSMEDKGQQVLKTKREEVVKLLDAATIDDGDGDANLAAAAARVDALRTLCQVWAGTAEEKARVKFVDGLQRLVDDRRRELDNERERLEQQRKLQQERRDKEAAKAAAGGDGSSAAASGGSSQRTASPGAASSQGSQGSSDAGTARGYAAAGYGFISQLQKIRNGL